MVDSATAALYLALSGMAPGGQTDSTPGSASMVMAARAAAEISLDGILSEAGWSAAVPVSGFTQREPDEGAPATERTEVRILDDDDALYVGARLYDSKPDSIRAQLARRDRLSSSDRFPVFLKRSGRSAPDGRSAAWRTPEPITFSWSSCPIGGTRNT